MDLVDTDVLIDVQRGHPPALAWFAGLTDLPAVPGFVLIKSARRIGAAPLDMEFSMVRATTCFCLLLALPGTADTGEQPPSTPREALESWAEAWKSGNVEKLLPFYEDSKDVVAVASSGHLHKGLAEVRKMYEAAFREANWERVTLEGLEIRRDGNTAFGICRFKADFAPKAGKAKLVFTAQGSFVLRKHESSWKIALEHYSPIADVPRVQPRKE